MTDRRDGGERAWEVRGVLSRARCNWFGSLAGRKQGEEGEGGKNKNIVQSIKHILKR